MIKLNLAYFDIVLNKQPTIEEQIHYLRYFQKCYMAACLLTLVSEEQRNQRNIVIQNKKITLPRNFSKKKTLFIDLDKTLVISGINKNALFRESFHFKDTDLYFSLRPFAIQFLKKVSQYYQIILYSASIQNYVIQFFNYFNSKTNNCIKKCLSRDQCIEIKPNIFIQDIRLIKNRQPEKVVFLSNDILCFQQTPQNGIPIPSFTGSSHDKELQFILNYLIDASSAKDIREINNNTFNLRKLFFPSNKLNQEDTQSIVKSQQQTKC